MMLQAVDELARNQFHTPFLKYVATDISANSGPALKQVVKGAPLDFQVMLSSASCFKSCAILVTLAATLKRCCWCPSC